MIALHRWGLAASFLVVAYAREARAGETIVREPGFLDQDPSGKRVFVDAQGQRIEVLGGTFAAELTKIPIHVVGKMESRGDGTKYLKLAATEPNALLSWWGVEKQQTVAPQDGKLTALRTALTALDDIYLGATVGVATADSRAYEKGLEEVAAQVGRVALETEGQPTSPTVREARRHVLAQLKTYKALFGRDDVYHPHVFLRMYEHSRGGVAIVDRNEDRVFGSGVLVGADVVLTCDHCLYRDSLRTTLFEPGQLSVRFDFESGVSGTPPPSLTFPVTQFLARGGEDGPDYALLRIGKDESGSLPAASRVQRLSKTAARHQDALYVVGHPEARPRAIADNGFVLFPYEVDDRMYEIIAAYAQVETSGETDDGKAFQEFVKSYEPVGQVRKYRSVRWDRRPTIGADCDTFKGNSGSGVYLKRSHALVGIVYAGEEDRAEPWKPGWRRHEAIAPSVAILEDLEARFGGAAALGVQVE